MPPSYFPLRWESTGDQWWYASPIDWAAANGHYDLVRELLYLDTNLLIKLTSLRRIRRLETVWDDEEQFNDVAKCRSQVAQNLLMECESKGTHKTHNSLIRAGYGGWLLYTACSAGDVDFVKKLLEIDPNLVFGEGEYGVIDIFYAAARSKNSEVFRLLLDFSVSEGKLGGNCSDLDGKSKENFSVFRWEMMNRAVHAAARGGNLEILREIIGDSSDILVYRDAQGSTLLHSASGRGQIEVVKYLLASYDVIKSSDNQGNTALHVAAYRGHLAVVKVLISSSHSIASITNNYGDTFLHMAVAGFQTLGFRLVDRQIELIKEIVLGKSVNIEDMINVKNKSGRTALHMAVNENIKSEVVELLMRIFGINLNIRDNDGMTPLDLLKRRPRSASSEILIKRLISAGGISNCHDHVTRSAIVSHLKMAGIGASPGISFRIPDAEIFLYAGIENEIVPHACDIASTDYSPSSELGRFNSPDMSKSFGIKKSNSMRRLKMLFLGPRKERKYESCKIGDDDSINSYRVCKDFEGSPISLRERFSQQPSLPNNKRILSMRNRNSLPSPSTKKKFSARLMHGVLQAVPHLDFQSPSSPISESSRSSPISIDKQQGRVMVKEIEESPISNLSFDGESSQKNRKNSQKNRKNSPFDKKLMNRYLCFGAQGLAVEDPICCKQPHQIYKHSSSLIT